MLLMCRRVVVDELRHRRPQPSLGRTWLRRTGRLITAEAKMIGITPAWLTLSGM